MSGIDPDKPGQAHGQIAPGGPDGGSFIARQAIAKTGHHALSAYWRALFGRPARKIPLDAAFGCPNRDGTISRGGCAFCDAVGSGTGMGRLPLTAQWEHWRARRLAKYGGVALIGYLQAYSNTHGPIDRLAAVLDEMAALPDLAGLCLGTRPDCLDPAKLDLLAAFQERLPLPSHEAASRAKTDSPSSLETGAATAGQRSVPGPEFWLELGLQSSNPATLARMNRGHSPECFAWAVHQAAARGVKVVAHMMAGLPGDTPQDWLATVDFIADLPVAGIKFHNFFVVGASPLARDYAARPFPLPGLEAYARFVALALSRLRPGIVIHRLAADPPNGMLVAPDWAGRKRQVLDAVAGAMREMGVSQGSCAARDW
jgi:hypothetical protein